MAGRPKCRARRMAKKAALMAEAQGIPLEQAIAAVEAQEFGTMPSVADEKPFTDEVTRAPGMSTGEFHRRRIVAARERIASSQSAWLIGTPEEIANAYENDAEYRSKITPEIFEKILFFVRAGLPIKDTLFGPGAASQCDVHPATVWQLLHVVPECKRRFYEARDASAEVLEDELRAMLPSAVAQPHLLDALAFVAGKLEFLARARNRERFAPANNAGFSAEQITFNIHALPPKPLANDRAKTAIDVTPKKAPIARLPTEAKKTAKSAASKTGDARPDSRQQSDVTVGA